ncbi:MAG: hypothetical protein H0V68_11635 [Actinobacteria bacterium]|nr:hypothetical protein [Actinomycetota bacterium]
MAVFRRSKRSTELLLEHCLTLVCAPPRPTGPTAKDRLDAVLGRELARQLVAALSPTR